MLNKMKNSYIQVEKGKVSTVWLARPDKRNAINGDMATELMEAFRDLSNDQLVSVVVLRGQGNVFCAGGDLRWMSSGSENPDTHPPMVLAKLYQSLYHFDKPLIICVHGSAMGGALGLIACGDFVVADQGASFSFSEVRLGLIPATISPYVITRIGQTRAMQLMLSGQTIGSREAMDSGLVDILACDGQLDNTCHELTNALLQNAPGAMRACKQLVRKVSANEMDEKLKDYTVRTLDEIVRSEEAKEGMLAFREKRKPNWRKT